MLGYKSYLWHHYLLITLWLNQEPMIITQGQEANNNKNSNTYNIRKK